MRNTVAKVDFYNVTRRHFPQIFGNIVTESNLFNCYSLATKHLTLQSI